MADIGLVSQPGARPGQDTVVRPLSPGIVPASGTTADTMVDLGHLASALWRGLWLIAACVVLTVGLATWYLLDVAVPKYTAEARIVMEARDQNVVDLESVISGRGTDEASLNTEMSVMTSRTLLETLVRDLDLTADPEFNTRLEPAPALSAVGVVDRVRGWLGLPSLDAEPRTEQEVLLDTVDALAEVVFVRIEPYSYVFSIRAKTGDPHKSALIANRLAAIYLDQQISTKFSATEYAVDWLSQRVTELELELKQKEEAVLELSSVSLLMPEASLEALKARAREAYDRLAELETAALVAQEAADGLSARLADGDLRSAAELARDPEVFALLDIGDTTGALDRLRAALERLRQADAGAAEAVAAARAEHDTLTGRIEAEDAQRQDLTQRIRDADATRVLYQTFLARLKETSIQIGLQQADSRVLSAAVPGEEVAPRRAMILAVAALLGVVLGVGIILLRQYLNRGFRTADDLEQATGYTVLGQIPRMPLRRRRGVLDYLRRKPTSAAAEAIRNLRTSVLLSDVDTPPRVIMSTSSIPGEGKTTQSIALAQNLAGLGQKVLLVEGDIRRRTFAQYLDADAPGSLVQVVSGTLTLAEAVVSDPALEIDVLMGDRSSVNAADMFSSDSFRRFILSARNAYDYVVIDTPPVLVVPDARVLGRYADAIVYSVQWDRTSKEQVTAGLRMLSSVHLRITGLVLSQVDPKGMRRYGYGSRHGAYSGYGKAYYDAGA